VTKPRNNSVNSEIGISRQYSAYDYRHGTFIKAVHSHVLG